MIARSLSSHSVGPVVATSLACGCHPSALRSVPFATWVHPSVHEMMAASLLRCCIPLNACALARFIVSIAKVQKIIDAVKYKLLNKCKIYTFSRSPLFFIQSRSLGSEEP